MGTVNVTPELEKAASIFVRSLEAFSKYRLTPEAVNPEPLIITSLPTAAEIGMFTPLTGSCGVESPSSSDEHAVNVHITVHTISINNQIFLITSKFQINN